MCWAPIVVLIVALLSPIILLIVAVVLLIAALIVAVVLFIVALLIAVLVLMYVFVVPLALPVVAFQRMDAFQFATDGDKAAFTFFLILWCCGSLAFPWLMTWHSGPQGEWPAQVLLLSLFLTQLLLTKALRLLLPTYGSWASVLKVDAMRWTLGSRFSLRVAGILLDWYFFSALLLQVPGLQLPPSVRAIIQILFRMPWEWLLGFFGLASRAEMLIGALLAVLFVMLVVAPTLMILVQVQSEIIYFSERITQFTGIPLTPVVALVSRLPLGGELLLTVEAISGILLLPCLTCFLQLLVCVGEAEDMYLLAGPSIRCWSGWHLPLAFVCSALLASFVPLLYFIGVTVAANDTLQSKSSPSSPALRLAPGFLLIERPLKALAVGFCQVLPDSESSPRGALVKFAGLLSVSLCLALAARFVGSTNHVGLNRFQEVACWSMTINTAVSLVATWAAVGESYWTGLVWFLLQVLLWRSSYGGLADQGSARIIEGRNIQIRFRRGIRSAVLIASCVVLVLVAWWPELLAYNTSIYHEEYFSHDPDAYVRLDSCMLTVRPCATDSLCRSQGTGMIRRWGSLRDPLPNDDDVMNGSLQASLWVNSTSYGSCEINLWPRPNDTLRVFSTGSSILRINASLRVLHVKQVEKDGVCIGMHASIVLSSVQSFRFEASCHSYLWAVVETRPQAVLDLQLSLHGGSADIRLKHLASVDACLLPSQACIDTTGAMDVTRNCSELGFQLTAGLEDARLTLAGLQQQMQVSGVLSNSTLQAMQAVDWQQFVVFTLGPAQQLAVLQPPGAPAWVHLPWKTFQGLKPWWLAVMSGGLFPLPPVLVQIDYEGCATEHDAGREVAGLIPEQDTLVVVQPGPPRQEPTWLLVESAVEAGFFSSIWSPVCFALCGLIAAVGFLGGLWTALLGADELRIIIRSGPRATLRSIPRAFDMLCDLPCFWSWQSALFAWNLVGAESVIFEVLAMPQVMLRSGQHATFEALTLSQHHFPTTQFQLIEHGMKGGNLWQSFCRLCIPVPLPSNHLTELPQTHGSGHTPATASQVVKFVATLENVLFWKKRAAAAVTLGQIGPVAAEAVPQLVQALLKDRDSDVRRAAAAALGQIGPVAAEAVPQLVQASLKDGDSDVRRAAAAALGQIGPLAAEAVPQLVQVLLKDRDSDVRRAAATALGQIGPLAAEAVPQLVQASLKDRGWRVQMAAAAALGQIGPVAAEAVPQLVQASLKDGDSDVRRAAAAALGQIGPVAAEAVPQLVQASLKDGDSDVRRAAAAALGQIGPLAAEAVPQLVQVLLKDRDSDVRRAAATALGQIGPLAAEAVPQLVQALLKDRDSDVRRAAAAALSQIAVQALAQTKSFAAGDFTSFASRHLAQYLARLDCFHAWGEDADILRELGRLAAAGATQLSINTRTIGNTWQLRIELLPRLATMLRNPRYPEWRRDAAYWVAGLAVLAQIHKRAEIIQAIEGLQPRLARASFDREPEVAAAAVLAMNVCQKAGVDVGHLRLHDRICQVALRWIPQTMPDSSTDGADEYIAKVSLLAALADWDTCQVFRTLPTLMYVAMECKEPDLRQRASEAVSNLVYQPDSAGRRSSPAMHVFEAACSLYSVTRSLSLLAQCADKQATEVYCQHLTHAEVRCLTDAIASYQQITRPRQMSTFDLASTEVHKALRAFGIHAKLSDSQSQAEDGQSSGCTLVLESPIHKPRHLNLFAIQELARRAKQLQQLAHSTGPASMRLQELPHVLPILRPGWLLVDVSSGLLHAFVCMLFAFWPCIFSLALALAAEPYGHFSPADHLSSLHLTARITELPRRLVEDSPFGHVLIPFCCVVFLLLLCSCLRSYYTLSLPCTMLNLAADVSKRSAARQQAVTASWQHRLLSLADTLAHVFPWICCLCIVGVASAYLCLVFTWLVIGLVVDAKRIVPLLTSVCSFLLLVLNRARLWLRLRREVWGQLHELAGKVLLRIVGAGVAALSLPRAGAEASFERLKAGKGSDADLFHALARAVENGEATEMTVSVARVRLTYRAVLSRQRFRAILQGLPKQADADSELSQLDLEYFLLFQKAVREYVVRATLQSLGLDGLSGFRMLKRLSILALLLFALLLVVLLAFEVTEDPVGLVVSGLLPAVLGFLLNGTFPTKQVQDLVEQLEERCTEWQISAVDSVREAQHVVKETLLEACPSEGFLAEELQAWLQQLDLFTILALLDELGSLQAVRDLAKPAQLLTKLSSLRAQDLIPASVVEGLWTVVIDCGLALLNEAFPLPESVVFALKGFKDAPSAARALQQVAQSLTGSTEHQIVQVFCVLLRVLVTELPEPAMKDLWGHLAASAQTALSELGVSSQLIQKCKDLDLTSAKACLQKCFERMSLELEAQDPQASMYKSLEACLHQLTLLMLAEALRQLVRDPNLSTEALNSCLSQLELVDSPKEVLDILKDPEALMGKLGNLALDFAFIEQRRVLEQAFNISLTEEQLAVCREVLAQDGVMALSPARLFPRLLSLPLEQLILLEPLWNWARETAVASAAREGLPTAFLQSLQTLDLRDLLVSLKRLHKKKQLESNAQADLTFLCLLLLQSALLCAFRSFSKSLEPLLLASDLPQLKILCQRLYEHPDAVGDLLPELVSAHAEGMVKKIAVRTPVIKLQSASVLLLQDVLQW